MGNQAPDELDRALLDLFAQGLDAPRDDAAFNALALAVFAYQYDALPAYHAYCQRRGALPQRLRHWTEIPAVPAQAFKDVRLWCDDDGATPPAAVFRTSGTTTAGRSGEHYMSAAGLALYDASLVPTFRACVLREPGSSGGGAREVEERSPDLLLALGPSASAAPHSSLWHMVDVVGRTLFTEPARPFVGDPSGALDVVGLLRALEGAAREDRTVCLVTTDLALDAFLEALAARSVRLQLPRRSRLVHTGGAKGRRRELDPESLLARAQEALGIHPDLCVAEYGMTELASQFYRGRVRPGHAGRFYHGPPWIRATVMDVHTLEPVPPGAPGVLRFHDLANRHSAFVVQSEDFAVAATDEEARADGADAGAGLAPIPDGLRPFQLLGRAEGSEPRGCSLDAEEALA
jgi:hypothetical protein